MTSQRAYHRDMITFSYTARSPRGEERTGVVEAETRGQALTQLQRDGLTVLRIDATVGTQRVNADQIKLKQAASQIGRDDVIAFASQMGVMLETGVPLAEAMDAVGASAKGSSSTGDGNQHNKISGLSRVLNAISSRVSGGEPFSAAIATFPRVFPPLMVSLVEAAEASGTMGPMMARVADYLDKDRKTSRKIRGALTYPLIMVGLSLVITGFLVTWVLPRFAKIYESREAALPRPTVIVLGISDFVQTQWPAILAGLIGLVIAYFATRATEGGKRLLDVLRIRLPVIGPMFNKFYMARGLRTLGTLLAAGVPLLDAVRIARGVTTNALWQELWDRVEHAMTNGQPVAGVLLDSDLIPTPVARMFAAGERAAKLPEVLDRVAETVEGDLDEAIHSATQLIEPAMIIFMGATIGGIAIALLLPIFSIANTV